MQIYKILMYGVGYIVIYTEFYYDQDSTDIKRASCFEVRVPSKPAQNIWMPQPA
jgi:hypothetical protein